MHGAKVIDADSHVRDRDAEIRKFMKEPYCRRQGPLVAKDKWDSSLYGKLGKRVDDVPSRLRDMDQEGIDVSVLFPTDWIAELCKESLRLKGVGLAPFQDIAAAVAEIDRAVTNLGSPGSPSRPTV